MAHWEGDRQVVYPGLHDHQPPIMHSRSSGPPLATVLLSAEIIVAGALALYGIFLIVLKLINASKQTYPCERCKEGKTSKKRRLRTIVVSDQSFPSAKVLEVKCEPKKQSKPKVRHYTTAEVMCITDTLKFKLGHGGSGAVYYGKLSNGLQVAVKRLSSDYAQHAASFQTEVELMSQVCHNNIVTMIGYCCELNERMLIYEYMPGGALHDRLYGREAVHEPLTWQQRLQIALDTAKGLDYLHSGCKPPILHRDVKSSNILLDESLHAKVADFGLSKILHENMSVSNGIKGTVGYLDPEYFASQRADEMSDVYGLGIVMLELICGRHAVVPISEDPSVLQNIVNWVTPFLHSNDLDAIVDKAIKNSFNACSMELVMKVALLSVERNSSQRPSTREIIATLSEAMDVEMKDEQKQDVESNQQVCSMSCFPWKSYPKEFPFYKL